MKLISSPTSPYAQKVRVVAIEKGIDLEVENVAPLSEGSINQIKNPLGKVPTLILDNGKTLFDSVVICNYLDSLSDQAPLNSDEVIPTQRNHALGDGIMDCAFSMVMEGNRTDSQPSQFWLSRWRDAIERSIDEIDRVTQDTPEAFDLGTIAMVCALNYVIFRLPDINWQLRHPKLNKWYELQLTRDSFQRTTLG